MISITLSGPHGRRTIPADDATSMPAEQSAQILLAIQHAIDTRPGLDIRVTDAPNGDIVIEWRTK